MRRFALLAPLVIALLAAPSVAAFRLAGPLAALPHNPADALDAQPIDPEVYDGATHCSPKPKPGMVAFVRWMERHARRGVSWGTYRCEKWGKRSASLHAENRALDWHLDVTNPADRAEAKRLIDLLLAPDRNGNQHALARRMGIEELIWDCSYWSAGSADFTRYAPCYDKHGRRLRHVDPTVGHRNHIHFGMSSAGAAARTTFWRAAHAVSTRG